MKKSFFILTLIILFSFASFAASPQHKTLFERLGITEDFLNHPKFSPKKPGFALVQEYSALEDDPNVISGDVIYRASPGIEDKSHEHGNIVAGVVSRFLPKGKTILRGIQSMVNIGNYLNDGGIDLYKLVPVMNCSIDEEGDCLDLGDILNLLLKDSILVLAAGNESVFLGGKEDLEKSTLARAIARLNPEAKKRIVFVGATTRCDDREVLDSDYSNIAGNYGPNFVLAPSGFLQYSPKKRKEEIQFGTSFAAPIVTGILTRALLAFPNLPEEKAVELLFQTANKRNLSSTGDNQLDLSLYGHGVVDVPLFLKVVEIYNQYHDQEQELETRLGPLTRDPLNIFKSYGETLREKLDVLDLLHNYKELQKYCQITARQGPMNIENFPKSMFKLDDLCGCSEIFKARGVPSSQFYNFALSTFSSVRFSEEGSSLLTLAIVEEMNHFAQYLLKMNFDIHLRGKSEDGYPGPLPIHAAAFVGDEVIFKELILRGADIKGQVEYSQGVLDSLVLAVQGADKYSNFDERLRILDMLYHQGADFCQKVEDESLLEFTSELLGEDSQVTKRIKYYAENSDKIVRKPLALRSKTEPKPPKKVEPKRPVLKKRVLTKKEAKRERKKLKKRNKLEGRKIKKLKKLERKKIKRKRKLQRRASKRLYKLNRKEYKRAKKLRKRAFKKRKKLKKKKRKGAKNSRKRNKRKT